MEKTEVKIFGKIRKKEEQNPTAQTVKAVGADVLCCLFGFFCGQGVCFGGYYPLGLSAAGAFLGVGRKFYLVLAAAAVGFVRTAGSGDWVRYGLAAFGLLVAAFLLRSKEVSPEGRGGAAALATLGSGLIVAAASGFSSFLALTAVLEAAAVGVLTILSAKGMAVALLPGRGRLTAEEGLSLAAVVAMVLMGSGGLQFGSISLTVCASAFLVLLLGYGGGAGAGAATGVLLGFLLLLTGQVGVAYFCLLSLLGLCAGGLKDMGRVPVALGFLACAAAAGFFLDRSLLNREFFTALGVGAGVFLLMPVKTFTRFAPIDKENTAKSLQVCSRMRQRLLDASDAFSALSVAVEVDEEDQKQELSSIVDAVGEQVCATCRGASNCWHERGELTYGALKLGTERCRSRGMVRLEELPKAFVEGCSRSNEFVAALNQSCISLWEDKLRQGEAAETRGILGEQMARVSEILRGLSREMENGCEPLVAETEKLAAALAERKIAATAAAVWEMENGVWEAEIRCKNPVRATEATVEVLSGLSGKKFAQQSELYLEGEGLFQVRIRSVPKFRVSVAVAAENKAGNSQSGDSHTTLEAGSGMVLALSDGMGAGKSAMLQSRRTVELLEKFLAAGFQAEEAVRLLNSALFMGSTKESFSTLDLCVVDRDQGTAEFVKVGASTAFLLRDKKVKSIRGSALPLGILPGGDISRESLSLQDGDILVMLTDGAAEALEKKNGTAELTRLLRRFPGRSPRDLADYLMCTAKEAGEPRDDMTVLVGRVWKEAG